MEDCKKHKFEARYDSKWTTIPEEILLKEFSDPRSYLKTETYIYDICIRCGQTVKRKDR